MASPPIPIDLRRATLHIDADDYTLSVDQVRFVPTFETEWFTPHNGTNSMPFVGVFRWFVQVGFVQDYTNPDSLAVYLIEHAGQNKTITFEIPGRVIAATVVIVPAQVGGVANTIPAAVVTMPVHGSPDFGLGQVA